MHVRDEGGWQCFDACLEPACEVLSNGSSACAISKFIPCVQKRYTVVLSLCERQSLHLSRSLGMKCGNCACGTTSHARTKSSCNRSVGVVSCHSVGSPCVWETHCGPCRVKRGDESDEEEDVKLTRQINYREGGASVSPRHGGSVSPQQDTFADDRKGGVTYAYKVSSSRHAASVKPFCRTLDVMQP